MHRRDVATEVLTQAIVRYAVERLRLDPPPLDNSRPEADLRAMAGRTITPDGIGGLEALRIFADVLAPSCISTDHPRFFAFVPVAPTEAAMLFDLVVGSSALYGGSWLEGAGAVFAENEALRWLADLAGFPPGAGGVFVSGGSAANLSALTAARYRWRLGRPDRETVRGAVLASAAAHSSVVAAARVMDADVIEVPAGAAGQLTAQALRRAEDELDLDRAFAVVATAGTTNAGVVDDLDAAADAAEGLGVWLHVDGAYGLAGLAAPSVRHLFIGIDRADSFVVDPHKWLFAPYDCAALLYRDQAIARATFTQHAEYLEVLNERHDWNPSDYAYHLSRRARGLPFWFSLATYGTQAYQDAIEATLTLTRDAAELIRVTPHLELLVEPELSVVMFRRVGWTSTDYHAWSDRLLTEGTAFVVPTTWDGEAVLRCCFVNPLTTVDDVRVVFDSLA